MAERKRNKEIHFYVTEEERKLIRRKMIESKTKNMGAYLRKMAIDGSILHAAGSAGTLIISQFIFSSSFQRYDMVNRHLFIRYFCPTDLTYSMVFSVNHLSFLFSDTFPFCVHVILFILFLPIYIRIRHKKMTAFYKFLQKKLLRFPTTTFQPFITLIFEIVFPLLPAAPSEAAKAPHRLHRIPLTFQSLGSS